LDTSVCKPLLIALQAGHEISLTLCGDDGWRHYRPVKTSVLNSLINFFKPMTISQEFKALASKVAKP
jgi:hypothetical protein